MNILFLVVALALVAAVVAFGVAIVELPDKDTGEKGNVTIDLNNLPEIDILRLEGTKDTEEDCQDEEVLILHEDQLWCARLLEKVE